MALSTPETIRTLQRKLSRKAKSEQHGRMLAEEEHRKAVYGKTVRTV